MRSIDIGREINKNEHFCQTLLAMSAKNIFEGYEVVMD